RAVGDGPHGGHGGGSGLVRRARPCGGYRAGGRDDRDPGGGLVRRFDPRGGGLRFTGNERPGPVRVRGGPPAGRGGGVERPSSAGVAEPGGHGGGSRRRGGKAGGRVRRSGGEPFPGAGSGGAGRDVVVDERG